MCYYKVWEVGVAEHQVRMAFPELGPNLPIPPETEMREAEIKLVFGTVDRRVHGADIDIFSDTAGLEEKPK